MSPSLRYLLSFNMGLTHILAIFPRKWKKSLERAWESWQFCVLKRWDLLVLGVRLAVEQVFFFPFSLSSAAFSSPLLLQSHLVLWIGEWRRVLQKKVAVSRRIRLFIFSLSCLVVLHGLKSSCRSTGDMVGVDLSWLIGVTREENRMCSSMVEGWKFLMGRWVLC